MRKHLRPLAALTMAALLTVLAACGQPEENLASASPTISPSPTPIEPAEPSATPSPIPMDESAEEDTQVVGDETLGYVTIPDWWASFQDLGGATALQYSNGAGTIISLDTFSDEGLTEDQKAQITAETAAYSVWYNLEQNGVTDIVGAQVDLNGIDSFQVYGAYVSEDYGTSSIIVCWVFSDEDGGLHYVSAEGPVTEIAQAVGYVEDSYTLTPPEDLEHP